MRTRPFRRDARTRGEPDSERGPLRDRRARPAFLYRASVALIPLAALASSASCKRARSNDTLVLNTRIGFVNTRCGRNAPWFSQQWCAIPDANVRALAHPVAGLAVPQPLRHVEVGVDFAEQPAENFAEQTAENFAKLAASYGNGAVLTGVPAAAGTYYRVTDFHRPGLQALSGTELIGTKLPGTYAGVWAALSATNARVEFPKFPATTFLDAFTPGKPQAAGVRIVKEIVAADLVPMDPVSVNAISRKATRSANDAARHSSRYELLLPGDVLLVFERVAVASPTAPVAPAGPTTPPLKVKELVGGGEEGLGNAEPCLKGRKLVHTAILVEKDVWFETVLAPQGSLFRLAFLDDVAAHAQGLSGKPLGNLCFVVARKSAQVQGGPVVYPLATQMGGPAQVLEGYDLAALSAPGVARGFAAPVAGRLALIAPTGKCVQLRLMAPQGVASPSAPLACTGAPDAVPVAR